MCTQPIWARSKPKWVCEKSRVQVEINSKTKTSIKGNTTTANVFYRKELWRLLIKIICITTVQESRRLSESTTGDKIGTV